MQSNHSHTATDTTHQHVTQGETKPSGKAPYKRLKIIVNPASGRSRNSIYVRKIQKYLRNRGVTNHVFFTKKAGDAIEASHAAIKEGYDAVAVCGGDGTLREVVAGVIGAGIPIGIIPLGTGNIIAADLKIPRDPFKACDLIVQGLTRKIDVGKNDDSYFMIAAGAGYDCEVVAQVDLQMKSKVGRLAYIATGLRLLSRYKPVRYSLTSEEYNGTVNAIGIVVANSIRYGGYFRLKKNIMIDDGYLDVIVIKGRTWVDIIRIFTRVLFRSNLTPYDIFSFRTKKVHIESAEQETGFHNDSDVSGTLPQTFEIIENGIPIFIPDPNKPTSPLNNLFNRA